MGFIWTEPLVAPADVTHYSQYSEDVICAKIFDKIGTTNQFAVDIGAGDGGVLSNTAYFADQGWSREMFDVRTRNPAVHRHVITAENIEPLLLAYSVPKAFDLLSIDIDGNDYWVWKALREYRANVVIIEFNGSIEAGKSLTIEYDPDFNNPDALDDYFGASADALHNLGRDKRYHLLAATRSNLIFVSRHLIFRVDCEVEIPRARRRPRSDRDMIHV